jgi:three-Cys-motif partner protein
MTKKISAEASGLAESFFKVQTQESRVKAEIVENFFVGWARIIGGYQKKKGEPVALAYADLFAGRGVYEDGGEGTAVRVARKVLGNDTWRAATVLFLNEPEARLREVLQRTVESLPRARELRFVPIFREDVVDADYRRCLSELGNRSTLFFRRSVRIQGNYSQIAPRARRGRLW